MQGFRQNQQCPPKEPDTNTHHLRCLYNNRFLISKFVFSCLPQSAVSGKPRIYRQEQVCVGYRKATLHSPLPLLHPGSSSSFISPLRNSRLCSILVHLQVLSVWVFRNPVSADPFHRGNLCCDFLFFHPFFTHSISISRLYPTTLNDLPSSSRRTGPGNIVPRNVSEQCFLRQFSPILEKSSQTAAGIWMVVIAEDRICQCRASAGTIIRIHTV